jgi:cytidine deaminase
MNNRIADEALDCTSLIRQAFDARERAYVPYSGFMVGAALLTAGGKVYTGCNIENAAYSPSNCAERTAFFKAVYEGERHFKAIAVVGGPRGTDVGGFAYVYPCGVCRQVMAEFCGKGFEIIVAKSPEEYKLYTLKDLLPEAFGPEDLGQ